MKKIKILMIVGNLKICDGISSFVMNYYNKINHEKFSIDFFVVKDRVDDDYRNIIMSYGDNIYETQYTNLFDFLINFKKYRKIIKKNKYDIIHSNIIKANLIYFIYAKKYNIKRVLHSHSNLSYEKKYNKFINKILLKVINNNTDYRFACSIEAGKSLFGIKEFSVINNAIDVTKFKFNEKFSKKEKVHRHLEDKIVIGMVGRLSPEKNPLFAVNLAIKLHKVSKKFVLILIGSGTLKKQIFDLIKRENANEYIKLYGNRNDVSKLLNIFDIFIFPSKHEGLGIAAIEAQANGLKTIISNSVPSACKIIPATISLSLDLNKWSDYIIEYSKNIKRYDISQFYKSEFCIENEVKKLENLYIKILRG